MIASYIALREIVVDKNVNVHDYNNKIQNVDLSFFYIVKYIIKISAVMVSAFPFKCTASDKTILTQQPIVTQIILQPVHFNNATINLAKPKGFFGKCGMN